MTDRREYTAKVVGVDERTDVAVIKIEGKNLPTVRIGDPSKLQPGEWVDRDRLAVRLREQRDGRHRQRDLALDGREQLRAVHSDRRRGESGQLRRPAVQSERRSRRHQLADLQPHRRLHGLVVRGADRRREQRAASSSSARARSRAAASACRFRMSTRSSPTRSDWIVRAARSSAWSRKTVPARKPASSRATSS